MTSAIVFVIDVLLATLICGGIAFYLKTHLRLLLIELCGTPERASFWLAFCNVMLVLVPLLFVLGYVPDSGSNQNVIIQMAGQVRWGLFGFVLTLGFFGLALLIYIPKNNAQAVAAPPS